MKRNYLLSFIMLFLLVFTIGLASCSKENGKQSQEEIEAREVLDAIVVEDYQVTYDGKEHHIREAKFNYPKAGNVVYGSYTKYTEPGVYPYHVTFGYKGFYREVDVNLIIAKYKPVYTGPTELRVYLDEGDSFETPFDVEGVELKEPIHLTQIGDYTITIQSKESATYTESDPVTIQLYVRQTHDVFGFEDTTVIADGETAFTLNLDTSKTPLDTTKYTVTYTNNEGHKEFGKYHITATVTENSNNVVYDVYRAILTVDRAENTAFNDYVTEAFEYFFGDDQLTINILIGDYKQFGLEHQEAKWYTFEPYTAEDYAHDQQEVADLREEFNKYDKNTLSNKQLIDYEIIDEQIGEYEALFADRAYIDMPLTYVDQYGGYCAELPSEVEGFHIKNKEDLDDMIDLLSSVYDAFMSYYDYIVFRQEAGYPLNEYTLTKFIEYLDGVIEAYESEEDYYLIGIVNKSFLTNENLGLTIEERQNYATRITNIFRGDYLKAHQDLRTKTQTYLDAAKAEGGYLTDPNFDNRYFGQYDKGTDLYVIKLQNKLGKYNMTPDEYIEQVDKWLKTYLNKWSDLSRELSSKAENIADGKVKIVENTSFTSLLDYLKEFAKTIVPDLQANPKIDVVWMDKTVTANTSTAAYYMKSPLSESGFEYIHMNPDKLSEDYLDTLSTLSHEGYPGHLYAYVNCKENEGLSPFATLATNTTHGEGWATYVQIELNNYIAETKKNDADYEDWKMAMEYANAYDLMSYLLYTKCDFEVNYKKADVAGLKKAISKVGLSLGKDEAYEDLFHTFNENPATYPAYGYGKAYFWQLHLDAMEALGDNYDVVDFNQMLLSHGWCSLDRLQNYYEDYMSDALFKAGLGE